MTAPRGPAGPAARRYLLASLLACGQCGRRLESAWSNGKPAYRCRHGYTSATRPDPGRAKNTHIREDQILPHLAALAILLAACRKPDDAGTMQAGAPGAVADLVDQLRAAAAVLSSQHRPGGWGSCRASGVGFVGGQVKRTCCAECRRRFRFAHAPYRGDVR